MKIFDYLKAVCLYSLLLICFINFVDAQDSAAQTQRPVSAEALLLYDFPQSYGISAGFTRPISSVITNNVKANGQVVNKQSDLFVAGDVGFYRYPFNYTGVYLFPSIGTRTMKKLHYHEFAFGVGLLRTFYDGKVYEVNASGAVKEISLFGRFYATANFYYVLGWQFKKPGLQKFSIQLKPQLWFQFPYDSFIKPHLSAEVGIRYHLKNVNIQTKIRTKHLS